MNRVTVVVVNYKGIEDTKACLASLEKQTYQDFVIAAVENGSQDGSVKEFKKIEKKYGEKVKAFYNRKNLGFDGGVNTGIRWALKQDCEYVVLLNNDAIVDKNWLEELVKTADSNEKYGTVTCLLLHADGKTIDSTGDWYSKWGLAFPRNRDNPTSEAPDGGEVFGATGGASLHRTKMLREIGIFDEDFFAYYEDIDISFRAQLYGWKIYYQPRAIAYHQQGGTSGKMPGFTVYQAFKNQPLIYIKNVPQGLLVSIGIRFYLAYWLMFFNAVAKGNGRYALKGALESIWYGFKALKKRRHIQKHRRVSVKYIKSMLWPDLPPEQTGLRKFRKIFIGK